MKRPSPATGNTPEFPPPQPPNRRNRKTRELPNLSDCNCCNRRINSTNPRNRLGNLTSEWRIVLLCKSCNYLVESSQFCSYCLTRVSSEFYECRKCRRRIHKDCASKFSFSSSGNCIEEASVCFDCWMPNLLENEINRNRVVRNGISKKQLGKNGVKPASLASSGVCNLQEKGKVMEDVVNEASVVAEKKVGVAVKAKEKAFTKVIAVKKAKDLASAVLGIVAVDKGGEQGGGSVVDEDTQLAIRLHREMNSSPRISRNWCSLNTHCLDVPKVNELGLQRGNETSCSGRGTNVGVSGTDVDVGSIVGRERNGLSGARQECGNSFCRAHDGKSNGFFKGLVTYVRKGQASKVLKCKEEHTYPLKVYGRKTSQAVKLESVECPSQFTNMEAGQCSRTYSRKRVHCKRKLANSRFSLENGNLAPAAPLTCHKEPMALTNAS